MPDHPPLAPPIMPPSGEGAPRALADAPQLLVTFLAERDHPCPNCGYNLRALTSTRCPECSQALVLSIGLSEPRIGAYLGALSGPLAGAGAAALFLSLASYFTIKMGPPPRSESWPIFGITTIALVTHGLIIALLVQRRGRIWFRSLRGGPQAFTICLGWLIPFLFVAWFIASVR